MAATVAAITSGKGGVGKTEVTFTQSKRQSRLVADIPVVGPARRQGSKRAIATGGDEGDS